MLSQESKPPSCIFGEQKALRVWRGAAAELDESARFARERGASSGSGWKPNIPSGHKSRSAESARADGVAIIEDWGMGDRPCARGLALSAGKQKHRARNYDSVPDTALLCPAHLFSNTVKKSRTTHCRTQRKKISTGIVPAGQSRYGRDTPIPEIASFQHVTQFPGKEEL